MTEQHRATPSDWAQQEDWTNRSVFSHSSCILELRSRIEMLEAAQNQPAQAVTDPTWTDTPAPASSLVERNPECVANWPGCYEGGYDPHCCRFPKSCSCEVRQEAQPASSLVDRVATDAELCQVYNEKTTLRAVYNLGRQHGAAPIRSGPESALVERVADAIAAQATSAGIVNDRPARAAILEVAAAILDWWDSDEVARTGWEAAKWLEQEASQ
jgi:hypothetical protein